MPSLRYLLITFALLVYLYPVAAAPRYPLARRQDDSESTLGSTPIESSRPSSTSSLRASSTAQSESDQQSTTEEAASRPSVVVTSSTVPASPSPTASDAVKNEADSTTTSNEPLPLHPKITPALGLVGALLLITGALYAVVGIKNKWIYVFGSAAYLTALAVIVLIVYLMSPPVSNGVQGAFFVAALFTGLLFGALALIFSDLTDGLGCLLGGYCLSMWFLSLKEGGLITSTGGRAIFIGCMSVAGYCLSFSHYTRTYGLIGSISFSGATIAMLGVDCFSRAGWKEFWLYLWNLNPDTFPLNTYTYPLTKGIKVELAGVIVLSVFGIISQLRLWKLIKERRAVGATQRLEQEQNQQREEEERGRSIEDKFQKERSEWEAAYGEKDLRGSSDESGVTTPKSPSVYGTSDSSVTHGNTVSTTKTGLTRPTSKQATVTVVTVSDDEIQPIDATGTPMTTSQDDVVNRSAPINHVNGARPSSELVDPSPLSRSVSTTSSPKDSVPPPPVVIPLPFQIPPEDDVQSQTSHNASVSAIPDVGEEGVEESSSTRQSRSLGLSARPGMDRVWTKRDSSHSFQAENGVTLSHIEDDRASSVAATLDEEDEISLQKSSPLRSLSNTPVPSLSGTDSPQSLTINTDPKPDDLRSKCDSAQSPRLRHDTLVENEDNEKKSQSPGSTNPDKLPSSSSHGDKAESAVGDFSDALQARLSKVAQSYRTNEWAKHLEAADKPELDEIVEPESPGAQLDHERPAPVSEGIAQPFAVAKRSSKRISGDSNAHRNKAFMQITSNSAGQVQGQLQPLSRHASQIRDGGVRVSGTQLSAVVEPTRKRVSSGPTPMPSNTLMSKRESLMRNRASSQNFNQQAGSSNDLTAVNDEDMTLAQRKRALKHHKPPSVAHKWQKNSWVAGPQMEGFNSHQPKRTTGSGSDQKREVLLAGWRESIQQSSAAVQDEAQRAAMVQAKRQKEVEKQQQAMMLQHRESIKDNAMRSTEMLDVHREAMRRMQAAANKNS